MIKTITIAQVIDIEMDDISNHILGEIYDYLVDYAGIESPRDMISDYDAFVIDILKNTINYISEED